METLTKQEGLITKIIGPVIDVEFQQGELPEIYTALHISKDDGSCVVAEVRNYWFWLKKKVLIIPPVGRPKWSALCPRFWRIQDCASQRQSSNFRACSNLAAVL